jgi:hypothetical protein
MGCLDGVVPTPTAAQNHWGANVMKMKLPLNNQTLFHAAGLLSTVASVSGVFSYLMVENNAVDKLLSIGGVMSVGGAVGLGLSIYFGWEVAFNHRGIAKRLAAGLIATSAATLSGYTIYQNTAHPILEQEHTALLQQQTRTLQQQSAAAALLQQQQADLRTQIEDLRQQNTADAASIKTLEAGGKKGAAWQAAELRKAMDGRTAEITKLSDRVENYTQRLTTTPESKEGQENQQTPSTDEPVLSWAMLARASMYEVMTALFLLFGSWYRADRSEKENAQAAELHTVTVMAQTALHGLQAATHTLVGVIAQAHEIADALEAGQVSTRTLLAEITGQLESIHAKAIEGAAIIQQQDHTSGRLQAETTAMQALLVSATETTEQLQRGIAPAKEASTQLQKTIVSANGLIANANGLIAGAIDEAIKDGVSIAETAIKAVFPIAETAINPVFSIAETAINQTTTEINDGFIMTYKLALKQLERQQMLTTDAGNVSVQSIMQATGLGRNKCEQLQQEAWEQGFLTRISKGRSYVYSYNNGADEAQQLDLTNVIQLTARNA